MWRLERSRFSTGCKLCLALSPGCDLRNFTREEKSQRLFLEGGASVPGILPRHLHLQARVEGAGPSPSVLSGMMAPNKVCPRPDPQNL